MSYEYYNSNPNNRRASDCVIRAISKVMNKAWEAVYMELTSKGMEYHDMPNSPNVIEKYLVMQGFEKKMLRNICPECTTVAEFAEDHSHGRYVLITEGHAVAVINGTYYDTWDSGDEVVIYYFEEVM